MVQQPMVNGATNKFFQFLILGMKSPIHVKCARSGELCKECRKKLELGKVSPLDVKLTEVLSRIEESESVGEIDFVKAYDISGVIFILVRSNISKLIGKGGKILRHIKRELDRKVRIINARTEDSIIRDTLFPVVPLYKSVVFRPEGKVLKIVIQKGMEKKLPFRKDVLQDALEAMLGKEVLIEVSA